MLKNVKNRKEEGFTIIEVLIVLAIAGLILLIVFLAVPALQRNSRNTARKTDIGRVSGALQEWQSNHAGTVFTAGAGGANVTEVINSAGSLGQYTPAYAAAIGANSFTVTTGTQAALTGGANNINLGSIQVVTGATCSTTTTGATTASSSNRRLAVQYLVEQGTSNVTAQCLDVQ